MSIFLDSIQKLQNENLSKYITLFNNLTVKELAEIVVVGEFSNGKSTLVNALIGLDILPSGIGSVTNNITIIKKGEINQLNTNNFTQENIDINEIKDVIEKESKRNNLKEIKIELTNFPFNDYVIVDTPGINDKNRERELITYEYAPKCDAMIFVLDISRGFTKYEIDFFTDLSETAKDKIFIVLNKYDAYEHIENEKIIEMLQQQGISEKKAFVVSSKMALAAIQDKNHEMLKSSGILTLRQELFQYVDNSHSRIVLRKRKLNILNRIKELSITEINSNVLALKMNKMDIEKNIRQLESDIFFAKQESSNLINQLNEKIQHVSDNVHTLLNNLKRELSDELFYKSPNDIQQFILSGRYAKIASKYIKEINGLLNSNIQEGTLEFKTDFILLFFEKLPFLKEFINSPILEDLADIFFSVTTVNPTVKAVFELMKKYSKVAFDHISHNMVELSTLNEKIDNAIANIENTVKYEIDRCVNDQKMSIFYKEEELNSKILGFKKASDEKFNEKNNLEDLINEQELLKIALLEGYEIELANLTGA
jgi:GTPase SAR1 family protein